MSAHLFEVEDATAFGVNEAIVLDHIRRWIAHNLANGKNERDGRTWTYNSVKAWTQLVPYFTPKQVRRAIDNLVAACVLVKGNFNASEYDRTLWYALGDGIKTAPICPTGQMDVPPRANSSAPTGNCVEHRDTNEPTKEGLKQEAVRFVVWFLELLASTGAPAQALTPSVRTAWADAYEKLVRIDGRKKEEIVRVCRWARGDQFWAGNFLSPTKLRSRNKDRVLYYDVFLNRLSNGHAQNQRTNDRRLGVNSNAAAYDAYDQPVAPAVAPGA